MPPDPLLQRVVPALADVPGVVAIALGGSRARGTATDASDYDVGLYIPRGSHSTLIGCCTPRVDSPMRPRRHR